MANTVTSAITKPPRRSVRSLSVQEKVQAIDRVHEGESKASVARDIGVPESTLRGWCKGEEKLRGIVARSGSGTVSLADSSSPIDDAYDKSPKFTHTDNQSNNSLGQKRDYFTIEDTLHPSSIVKKIPKLDSANDVPTSDFNINQRFLESPINFSKSNDNDSISRNAFSPMMSTTSFPVKEELSDGKSSPNNTLPALAAIASAISNKNQLLYNAYSNGMLKDIVPKQETGNKPLDYSTKVSQALPRPDVNKALMLWLQAHREQAALPMSPLEARTADSSSWFWKLYKNYGVLPQVKDKKQIHNNYTFKTCEFFLFKNYILLIKKIFTKTQHFKNYNHQG